jgi:hypothetical protein
MSDQPDWMGLRACQPAQLLLAGGMDVHDDCGNEGSHGVGVQQCMGEDWDGDGAAAGAPSHGCERWPAVSVVTGTGGQGRAGFRAAATAATASTGNKLQVGTTIYFRRLTYKDSGEWGCPAGVVWEESSPVMQRLETAGS